MEDNIYRSYRKVYFIFMGFFGVHDSNRKKYLLERLAQFPDDIQTKKALEKVETELANLYKRKDKFTEAQAFYAIADVIEEEL